ncbi:MAG: ATP synthase F1 subunit delta [Gemmatimonadota bacterium]|nr:ATP synthase F1 subunit delta [Gemmatimonadota bacterium]
MRDESVARNYAEALLELADRHEGIEVYGAWMDTVAEMIAQNPKLAAFLGTPRIDASAKKQVLKDALGSEAPRPFVNFLLITIDKRRQRLLRLINEQYQPLLDQRLGRERVEVTVARPLDDAGRAELTRHLTGLLGHQAIPQIRVRPEILGGVVVKSGDRIFDGSVRHRMDRLRRRMLQTELTGAGDRTGDAR